jgi:hypothetical protein
VFEHRKPRQLCVDAALALLDQVKKQPFQLFILYGRTPVTLWKFRKGFINLRDQLKMQQDGIYRTTATLADSYKL